MLRRLCLFLAAAALGFVTLWPAPQPVAAAAPPPHRLFLPAITREATGASTPVQPAGQLSLNDFVASVADGAAAQVRGVYVAEVFALPVVQQPAGDLGFVSAEAQTLTQFSLAAQYGVTGLLAHNYAAGQQFFDLQPGAAVVVVYGDGSLKTYRITTLLRYQALDPNSPTSEFVDLETGTPASAADVFVRAYTGSDHITFQTCIAANGIGSWGRLFVIAEPE